MHQDNVVCDLYVKYCRPEVSNVTSSVGQTKLAYFDL